MKNNQNSKQPAPKKQSLFGLLFKPHLGPTLSPLRESTRILIHLIANVFAIYRLLPKNYPGLGDPDARMSLSHVMGTAWRNIRFTKEGAPQAILFFAIVGMMIFSVIAVVFSIMSFFVGTAQAAPREGTFAPADMDVAQSWLNYLFLNEKMQEQGYEGLLDGIPQREAFQKAFTTMLAFYSNAILIIAAVVLFYLLTAMLVETAHHGVAMGKNANQIWAPIRLVVAVGLLVPINGGLNSGQYIVVKMAELGSGLASQTWDIFLRTMAAYDFQAIPPNSPIVTKIGTDMISIGACKYAYNQRLGLLGILSSQVKEKQSSTVINGHKGTKYSYSTDELAGQDNCGWYFIPEAPPSANDAVKKAYAYQAAVFNEFKGDFFDIGERKIQDVMTEDGGGAGGRAGIMTNESLNLVLAYQMKVVAKMTELAKAANITADQTIDDIRPFGWVFAGTFLPSIERMQTAVSNAATAGVPSTQPPSLNPDGWAVFKNVGLSSLFGGIFGAVKTVIAGKIEADVSAKTAEDLADFYTLQSTEWAQKAAAADKIQCSAMLGLQDSSQLNGVQTGPIDWLFTQVDNVLAYFNVYDAQNGGWNSGTGGLCGIDSAAPGVPKFKLGIKLAGPDILQQLIRMGHGYVDAALSIAAISILGQAFGTLGGVGGALVGGGIGTLLGGPVGSVAGGAIGAGVGTAAGGIIGALAGLGLFIALILFVSGFTLGFVLPMYVFTRFFFAVVSWLGGVIEGVVAVPLISLAHLNPEGHGLPGGMAKQPYFYVFNILLRPVLTIFGLITGMLAFMITAIFLTYTYEWAVAASGGTAYGHEVVSKLIYTTLYVVTIYICANNSFALIDHLPEHALRWMGAGSQVMPKLGDAQQVAQYESAIAGYAGEKGITQISNASTGVSKSIADGYQTYKGKMKPDNGAPPGPSGGGGGGPGP